MNTDEKILVTRSFLPPRKEYDKYLDLIWENHWLTNQGELHNELQEKLQNYLGVKNVTLFTNGHLALDVAIKALGVKGEVITTPFTFASTTHAIIMNGATPVFADIKPSDCTIDEERVEALITDKTSAIVAVHVYGYPCNTSALFDIATRHGLKLIYDAAHVFGVKIDGKPIGTFGDVSMMSFHATKVFHTIEGGALLYADSSLRRSFDLYKNFGITGPETVEAVGLNAKMNEFAAAMGLCNLRYVDGEIEKRHKITDIYREILRDVSGIKIFEDIPGVAHNYAYMPIIIDEKKYGHSRDELFDRLAAKNIFTRKYFYPLTTDYQCFGTEFADAKVDNARYAANHVLTLPLYGELPPEMAENIAKFIRSLC